MSGSKTLHLQGKSLGNLGGCKCSPTRDKCFIPSYLLLITYYLLLIQQALDNLTAGIDAAIEEKGNKAGIPDFTVRRRELLVGYYSSLR